MQSQNWEFPKTKAYQHFSESVERVVLFSQLAITFQNSDQLKAIEDKFPSILGTEVIEIQKKTRERFGGLLNPCTVEAFGLEICLTKIVDSFEYFICEFFEEFYLRNPDTIKEGVLEKFDLKPILRESDAKAIKNAVVKAYIEQVARQLSRLLRELKNLAKEPNTINFDESDFKKIEKARVLRNLIVHNRSIIDIDFKGAFGSFGESGLVVGERYNLSQPKFQEHMENIMTIAFNINLAMPEIQDHAKKLALKNILEKLMAPDLNAATDEA